MKTKREHFNNNPHQSGNVLIYVLIAVALFAALSFTLARQSKDGNIKQIDQAKVEFLASQMLAYASQMQQGIEQMMITGSDIDELDLLRPQDSGFETAPYTHRVFHPLGGGMVYKHMPEEAKAQIASTYPAKWYLSRFNNIEWTPTSSTDVILAAHQIRKDICQSINKKITGDTAIPILTTDLNDVLLNSTSNIDFTVAVCADCEGYSALCVANKANTAYSFYNIVAAR